MKLRFLIGALLLAACSLAPYGTQLNPPCTVDDQCGSNQVCFPDGCGDPGRGIVVEVTPDTASGLHAQDFAVADKGVTATMAFEVAGPLTLSGSVQREEGPFGMTQLANYTDAITVTATGRSTLIPGVYRNYQLSSPKLDLGIYQMLVGAGTYTVTARAADKSIPFKVQENIVVNPGEPSGASFVFPSMDSTINLVGTVIKTTEAGAPPKRVLPDAFMEIQAFDSAGQPLSQPTEISKDQGDFQLAIDFSAALAESISLVVRPRDGIALVPTKTFVISPSPVASTTLPTLELGDYGSALVGTKGRVVGTDGSPVVGATVTAEGRVGGGGSFRSRSATSDREGYFKLDVLPSDGASAYTVTVIPDPASAQGITQLSLRPVLVGSEPTFGDKDIVCPDRIEVSGTLTLPDGLMAANVTVIATAIEAIDGRPLPNEPIRVQTDIGGRYAMKLDPAKYRVDHIPGGQMPRKSRVIRVERLLNTVGEQVKTYDIGEYPLSAGRTVNGIITVRPNGSAIGSGRPGANAKVRFFRVTSIEGQNSSLLIGEGITDDNGHYAVVLPDHPPSAASLVDGGSPDGGP